MYYKAYSFLDKKTGMYSAPFHVVHEAIAMRTARELVADIDTTVGRHPADFDLYLVGEFNDNTGIYSGVGPACVTSCAALVPTVTATFFDKETV